MSPATKKCTKCGETKARGEFNKSKRNKDGLRSECKSCMAQYYRANRDRILERQRRYQQANTAANLLVYSTRKEKRCPTCGEVKPSSEFHKDSSTPGGLSSRCKTCHTARVRSWQENNPHKARVITFRRLARLAQAPGGKFDRDRSDYQARLKYYGHVCAYCGKAPATELDHAIPVSRGGGNWASNIRPACFTCNTSKGKKKLFTEWVPPRLRNTPAGPGASHG